MSHRLLTALLHSSSWGGADTLSYGTSFFYDFLIFRVPEPWSSQVYQYDEEMIKAIKLCRGHRLFTGLI